MIWFSWLAISRTWWCVHINVNVMFLKKQNKIGLDRILHLADFSIWVHSFLYPHHSNSIVDMRFTQLSTIQNPLNTENKVFT